MIKILHYCWFGGKPVPTNIIEYMRSWEKYCPDFILKRWDESNFDVHSIPFVEEAYNAGQWAFVSDYVRTYALFHDGGLYVDTDVEFVKSIDDLLDDSFMGFESKDTVNPGLILYASEPQLPIYRELLLFYATLHFNEERKSEITSPVIYTAMLEKYGLIRNNTLQKIRNIVVYPTEYFQPWQRNNWGTTNNISNNTRTIHHYDASWLNILEKQYYHLRKKYGEFWGRLFFTFKHPKIAFDKLKKSHKNNSEEKKGS